MAALRRTEDQRQWERGGVRIEQASLEMDGVLMAKSKLGATHRRIG
jgi:hypothetical protein